VREQGSVSPLTSSNGGGAIPQWAKYLANKVAHELDLMDGELERNIIANALVAERMAERERCAKVCDDIDNKCGNEGGLGNACAAAIRAQGAE
jgi:hypothetical protein